MPEIASIEDRDRISAKGFVYGYIGSVLLQLICFVFVMVKPFGIEESRGAQISFLLVGMAFGAALAGWQLEKFQNITNIDKVKLPWYVLLALVVLYKPTDVPT